MQDQQGDVVELRGLSHRHLQVLGIHAGRDLPAEMCVAGAVDLFDDRSVLDRDVERNDL